MSSLTVHTLRGPPPLTISVNADSVSHTKTAASSAAGATGSFAHAEAPPAPPEEIQTAALDAAGNLATLLQSLRSRGDQAALAQAPGYTPLR